MKKILVLAAIVMGIGGAYLVTVEDERDPDAEAVAEALALHTRAIQAALASGALPNERWQSYLKLLVEQETMAARLHARRDQPKKISWRKAAKESRVRPRITADHD